MYIRLIVILTALTNAGATSSLGESVHSERRLLRRVETESEGQLRRTGFYQDRRPLPLPDTDRRLRQIGSEPGAVRENSGGFPEPIDPQSENDEGRLDDSTDYSQ